MTNPYPIDKNLKTLGEGSPEFVDVVRVQVNGTAIFPLKFYPRAITPEGMLPAATLIQSSWQSVARPTEQIFAHSSLNGLAILRLRIFDW
jgi:hypothetical protein